MARHPGVTDALRWLKPNPNLPPDLLAISTMIEVAADDVLMAIPIDSPQLTDGLKKLIEAKDCFVRAAISAEEAKTDA